MAAHNSSRKGVRTRNAGKAKRGTGHSGGGTPKPDPVYVYLQELSHTLDVALCAATAAVMALTHQAAERDDDVANLLDYCCCGPLDDEIQKVRKLLTQLERRRLSPSTPSRPDHGDSKK
jgi:hypothetical protein